VKLEFYIFNVESTLKVNLLISNEPQMSLFYYVFVHVCYVSPRIRLYNDLIFVIAIFKSDFLCNPFEVSSSL